MTQRIAQNQLSPSSGSTQLPHLILYDLPTLLKVSNQQIEQIGRAGYIQAVIATQDMVTSFQHDTEETPRTCAHFLRERGYEVGAFIFVMTCDNLSLLQLGLPRWVRFHPSCYISRSDAKQLLPTAQQITLEQLFYLPQPTTE